jgi:hypothetical protein
VPAADDETGSNIDKRRERERPAYRSVSRFRGKLRRTGSFLLFRPRPAVLCPRSMMKRVRILINAGNAKGRLTAPFPAFAENCAGRGPFSFSKRKRFAYSRFDKRL